MSKKCWTMSSALLSSKTFARASFAAGASLMACNFSLSIANAQDSEPPDLDLSHAWFEPTLTLSDDAVCPPVLADTRSIFFTRRHMNVVTRRRGVEFAGLEPVEFEDLQSEPILEIDEKTGQPTGRSRPGFSIATRGKKFYLATRTNPGCGGGCETYQIVVAPHPVPYADRRAIGEELSATPAGVSHLLFRTPEETYYAAVISEGKLHFSRLGAAGTWDRACEVALEPQDMGSVPNADLRSALASVNSLWLAVEDLRRGAGNCGSLKAHWLHRDALNRGLLLTLYRPWALGAGDGQWWEAQRLDPAVLQEKLAAWSMMGQSEYEAMATYMAERVKTMRELADFYSRSFRWSAAQSRAIAERALDGAIELGFAFGAYEPAAGEAEILALRAAILERRAPSEIRAIELNTATAMAESTDQYRAAPESVLNIAVSYPEALRYLLERGFDPNQPNAFGKTPLMYAAQYNQFKAVELLLEHGANPNAATTWPQDDCYYTLERARMTPLHYAVRYGSAELVELLVTRGAVTFVKTEDRAFDRPEEYPLDWLKRYTSADAAERNPNIVDGEIERLTELLRVPSEAELGQIATRLTEVGEAEYAAGNSKAAYRSLTAALHAEPGNARVLSDMSLVALKLGLRGESLEAGSNLIATSKDTGRKANAWFNRGLACEGKARGSLFYNGTYYCTESQISTFLRAWTTKPTRDRADKIDQLFRDGTLPSCAVPQSDSSVRRYHFTYSDDDFDRRYTQRIYVYHPKRQSVEPRAVHWDVTFHTSAGPDKKPTTIVPRLIERYDLGEFAVTVLEADSGAREPVYVENQQCKLSR